MSASREQFRVVTQNLETGSLLTEKDLDDVWAAVEQEMRSVYEMARFSLNVTDLPDAQNIDMFRGFCEDADGIEPRNEELLYRITRDVTEIHESMGAIAINRVLIPEGLEKEYENYVSKRREYYMRSLEGEDFKAPPDSEVAHDGQDQQQQPLMPDDSLQIRTTASAGLEVLPLSPDPLSPDGLPDAERLQALVRAVKVRTEKCQLVFENMMDGLAQVYNEPAGTAYAHLEGQP